MTDSVRLTLISHAMTDAMSAGRFPADEPLSATGRRQAQMVADVVVGPGAIQLAGPELRARETAELLGLHARTDPSLTDLDCGRWRGLNLRDVCPGQLQVWLTDPVQAPHGGESILDLIARVAGWLESVANAAGQTVAVTHPAVIRAATLLALGSPAESFWRIDIAPVGRTVMRFRDHRWTVRL
ncbi:Phosphoserine phosphatase 1 [Mycobacterium basiliense]|uniref:Phosphoserine phosphatase 1 n=1 Tax=Mycobacterium basiliense TaxID=2094119 RepID=A0A447GK52_9MYCO|nr:histidine phosphatase family protein [Mycobacterium basiliense]VDM90887.1 Phosphoserine phosphatase 1 [Mycobacterium basiliense]